VTTGFVGNTIVDTLRDTGCSGVVVHRDLVIDEWDDELQWIVYTVGWNYIERSYG